MKSDSVSLRRTAEGVEVLCYSPTRTLAEAEGMCLFGNSVPTIAGISKIFPLTNFVNETGSAVPGTIETVTSPISSGAKKTGFPEGSSADDFDLDDFVEVAKARYGLSKKNLTKLGGFIDDIKILESDKFASSEATEARSLQDLISHVEIASLVPGLVEGQLIEFRGVMDLSDSERQYIDDILAAMGHKRYSPKYYLPPELIKRFYTEGKNLIVGSEALRTLKAILMCKLCSAFSTASCYSDWTDVKDANGAAKVAK